MKKIIKIGVVFFSLLILGSCTTGWQDLNVDPNSASDVPASSILINTERAMTEIFNDMWWTGNNTTAYAGQVCKIQYIDENRYQERSSIVERWGTIMGYQVDLNQIIKKAQVAENPALEGVALTLKAMLWQIMTDTWENVPFTEGARGDEGILHPSYDTQDEVYAGILTMLDDANALFAEGGTIQSDIINNNNVLLWQKFCNSLHLRVAIRMSNVAPATAKAELQKILGASATYPILSSNADLVALEWLGTSPYQEMWYEDRESPRDDHGMCNTFVDALNATADPRLPVFANRATSDNAYRGAISGMTPTQQQAMAIADISRIGDYFRARASRCRLLYALC